jgi:hypothetical protein
MYNVHIQFWQSNLLPSTLSIIQGVGVGGGWGKQEKGPNTPNTGHWLNLGGHPGLEGNMT